MRFEKCFCKYITLFIFNCQNECLETDILNKPNQASVIGDRLATEHLQNQDEFTMKRVNSFISIFRKHPSLRKLFTEVSRK